MFVTHKSGTFGDQDVYAVALNRGSIGLHRARCDAETKDCISAHSNYTVLAHFPVILSSTAPTNICLCSQFNLIDKFHGAYQIQFGDKPQ
jgi:hypothetical protein